MKRACLIALICMLPQAAQAERMRDMSLSPEETMQQPNIKYNHDPFVPAGANTGGIGQTGSFTNGNNGYGNNAAMPAAPSGQFMTSYCDPNFQAGIGVSAAMRSCINEGRKQACQRFTMLPNDAKKLIDHAIGCANLADAGNEQPTTGCNGEDDNGKILDMIKRYWQDQDTVYTLVYLPDMVMNASNACMRTR